jgi:hypothetical protein
MRTNLVVPLSGSNGFSCFTVPPAFLFPQYFKIYSLVSVLEVGLRCLRARFCKSICFICKPNVFVYVNQMFLYLETYCFVDPDCRLNVPWLSLNFPWMSLNVALMFLYVLWLSSNVSHVPWMSLNVPRESLNVPWLSLIVFLCLLCRVRGFKRGGHLVTCMAVRWQTRLVLTVLSVLNMAATHDYGLASAVRPLSHHRRLHATASHAHSHNAKAKQPPQRLPLITHNRSSSRSVVCLITRTFTECSLNVHWMFDKSSLKVHWMFTKCSLKFH